MILRAAVDQVTAEDISKLQAILDQAQEAYEQGDYKRVQEMDVRFHLSILDLTKNPFIIRMVRGINTESDAASGRARATASAPFLALVRSFLLLHGRDFHISLQYYTHK